MHLLEVRISCKLGTAGSMYNNYPGCHAPMNVLAIGAHPDDIEFGCFGTLALHSAKNDKVLGIVITNGELGGDEKIRCAEALDAAKLVNMRLFFADANDGRVSDDHVLVKYIEDIIIENNIDVLYTHTIHDRHQDHRNVARASISAARSIKEAYSYETPSSLYPFPPQIFVDVSSTFDIKIKALRKHISQQAKRYMEIPAVEGLAKYRGYQCGMHGRMCEAFEVIRILRKI